MDCKVKITADSTCDLSKELLDKYDVTLLPLFVTMGDVSYKDGVDITPQDIYDYVDRTGELPKTAAVSLEDYSRVFGEHTAKGKSIVHICIGSGFSSCYQIACLAAEQFENVYVIDSQNLCTGSGHLVIEAATRAQQGMAPAQIQAELLKLIPKVDTSFLIEQLDYLEKGGRCSAIMALGANLLKLRPCIELTDGKLNPAKKYRGLYAKCVEQYVTDRVKDRPELCRKRAILSHTKQDSPEQLEAARRALREHGGFEEILETEAGSTIVTHCGPNTIGVMLMRK